MQMGVQNLCSLGDMGTGVHNVLRVAVTAVMFLTAFDVTFGFVSEAITGVVVASTGTCQA